MQVNREFWAGTELISAAAGCKPNHHYFVSWVTRVIALGERIGSLSGECGPAAAETSLPRPGSEERVRRRRGTAVDTPDGLKYPAGVDFSPIRKEDPPAGREATPARHAHGS